MNPILRNIIAVITGVVIGSIVNMIIISISGSIIPPPEGTDNTTTEGLMEAMRLFAPKHFIFPFLAHAIGTLVGAFLAAKIATNHKIKFAFGIGAFFFLGGIVAVSMLPSPLWYNAVDLLGAYFPMAYLGGKLAMRKKSN